MPPKRGKRKKGKSKKEVTFGPTLAERNINAVKCSLSHFMKVENFNVKHPFHRYSLVGRYVDDVKLMRLLMEICRDPSSGISLNLEDSYIQYEAKKRQLATTKSSKEKKNASGEEAV